MEGLESRRNVTYSSPCSRSLENTQTVRSVCVYVYVGMCGYYPSFSFSCEHRGGKRQHDKNGTTKHYIYRTDHA
jgi:hypothetical protein